MEEGYEADYWLGVITAAAPGLDCSTEGKLLASLDRIEKELRAARRVQNAGVSAAHLSASSPTSTNAQKPQVRLHALISHVHCHLLETHLKVLMFSR